MDTALENYETSTETAERLGIDHSRVVRLCQQGRLKGAAKVGEGKRGRWLVPKDAWPTRSRFGPKGTWEESRPPSEWVERVPGGTAPGGTPPGVS